MNALKPILETRVISGRYDGNEFSVEAWLREGSEAFVHEIIVDGVHVPSGHLQVCMGITAALETGAHLAKYFIAGKHL